MTEWTALLWAWNATIAGPADCDGGGEVDKVTIECPICDSKFVLVHHILVSQLDLAEALSLTADPKDREWARDRLRETLALSWGDESE